MSKSKDPTYLAVRLLRTKIRKAKRREKGKAKMDMKRTLDGCCPCCGRSRYDY